MIYAKVETQKQQDELKAALRNAKKSHIYRRLLCIQLSSEGKKVNELSSMFHLCELTIRNYIQTYNESGLAKLIPKPKPGRKSKLSLTKEQWEEILHQSPSLFAKLDCYSFNWTLELLAEYVYKYHGVSLTLSGIWRQLRRLRISTGRSKLGVASNDAEYTVKRERIQTLKKKAQTGELTSDDVTLVDPGLMPISQTKPGLLVYFDETDIHWCPDTGKGFQSVGTQEIINSPGKDEVRYLLGSLVYSTGEGIYQIFPRKRTMEVEKHLLEMVTQFDEYFIFIIWDNAKTHTTEMLKPFFEEYQDRICPVFLPTYSPRLNLIERLWRQMRADITRNQFYLSIQGVCEAVVSWFSKLPFSRFLSLMSLQESEVLL